MQQKIIEIIQILIHEIYNFQGKSYADLELVSRKLIDKGYTEGEVQEALKWLFELFDDDPIQPIRQDPSIQDPGTLRILNSFEKEFFTPQAYGFLIQLQKLKLISIPKMELLIERCLMMGTDQVDVEDVKATFLQILWGRKTDLKGTTSVYYPGNETVH
ncbi:MAG: hypothetical protein Kow0042_29730 [Calditrichia bacterium]